MRVLVTGAAGFIGSYVVDRLLEKGHHVRALIRSTEQPSTLPWCEHSNVELAYGGFSTPRECDHLLESMNVVVHLAASQANSWRLQRQRTVADTETLAGMARKRHIKRFILASSFAIYNYNRIDRNSDIDEQAPLIPDTQDHGPYPWAKLQQERILRQAGPETNFQFIILRLGAVYGPNAAWTHRLGMMKGRIWFRIGSRAKIPLVYVENAADAFALAVDEPTAMNETLNVVDDNSPTQRQYMMELRARWTSRPWVVPINFLALRTVSSLAWSVARCFGQQHRVPLTLRPMCLDAMAKPFNYPNERIRQVLKWQPCVARVDALHKIFGQTK